jgi:hypothetical protein
MTMKTTIVAGAFRQVLALLLNPRSDLLLLPFPCWLARGASHRVHHRLGGAVVLLNDTCNDGMEDEGFGVSEAIQESVPEGLEGRGESEDDEGGKLPVLVGEPVEGDVRAVGSKSGELTLHGGRAVVGESEAVEGAPVNDSGDAVFLLVPGFKKVPELVGVTIPSATSYSGVSYSLVSEEDLDVLRACS